VEDTWTSGDAYERFIGRWSRRVAREMVAWLGVGGGRAWLDVGCGAGALTSVIVEECAPSGVIGIDPSAGFIAAARSRLRDDRVTFEVGDARALPVADAAFDAAVAGLVLNFVPDPVSAVREMRRAVRGGGVVAAYVWDYAEGMQMLRHFWNAAAAEDDVAVALDEARRFPTCHPIALSELFSAAGLIDVSARAIDVPTVFTSFDDFWTPFLGGQGPAPSYCLSLGEDRRAALRDRVRASLPMAVDGTIALTARAWAVRGASVGM
jgi:SAM-dependent methyltransferase